MSSGRIFYASYESFRNSVFESQVLGLVRRLQASGWEAHLLLFELPAVESNALSLQRRRAAEQQLTPGRLHVLRKLPMVGEFTFGWAARSLLARLTRLSAGPRDVLHCRGYYSGCLIGDIRTRRGLPSVVDFRGVGTDELRQTERKGAGKVRRRFHRRRIELEGRIEERAVRDATAHTAVSGPLAAYLTEHYCMRKPPTVVPCAYDDQLFRRDEDSRRRLRRELGWKDEEIVLVYSGSGNAWQRPEGTVELFRDFHRVDSRFRLLVVSTDRDVFQPLLARAGLEPPLAHLVSVAHAHVPAYLSAADVGLLLRDDALTNRVASPTKFGEYLACGLPVLVGGTVGDVNDTVLQEQVGWIQGELPATRLADRVLGEWREASFRCEPVARRRLSWDACMGRYVEIYQDLWQTAEGGS